MLQPLPLMTVGGNRTAVAFYTAKMPYEQTRKEAWCRSVSGELTYPSGDTAIAWSRKSPLRNATAIDTSAYNDANGGIDVVDARANVGNVADATANTKPSVPAQTGIGGW
jgi:uncharacterized protein (DUF1684 family)